MTSRVAYRLIVGGDGYGMPLGSYLAEILKEKEEWVAEYIAYSRIRAGARLPVPRALHPREGMVDVDSTRTSGELLTRLGRA